LVKSLASQISYQKVAQNILPTFTGWKLPSCPVLPTPFSPPGRLHSATNCAPKRVERFTVILSCWRWFLRSRTWDICRATEPCWGKAWGQTLHHPAFSSRCFVVFLRLLLPL